MIDFFVHSFNTLSHGLLGYAVPFLFVLTIVVFFHELGHFLVARWAGVRVLTFSLGFGPELVGFNDRHGTRWKISAIPLGGYVKFFGDESEASTPSAETLAAMTAEERAGSFHHKKVGPRAAIVAAGPIANFILGALIFAGMALYYGKPSTIARVDGVVADGAAAAAGFKIGDVVVQIDGKPIESFADMQRIVAMNAGSALAFQVKRDGAIVSLTATPALLERKDPFGNSHRLGVLGVEHKSQAGEASTTPVGVGEALKIGVEQVWFIITPPRNTGTSTVGHLGVDAARDHRGQPDHAEQPGLHRAERLERLRRDLHAPEQERRRARRATARQRVAEALRVSSTIPPAWSRSSWVSANCSWPPRPKPNRPSAS